MYFCQKLKTQIMKKTLLFIGLFIGLNSFGQEIKIKKDKISLDGVEVAMLDKNKLVYTIATLRQCS